MLRYDPIPAVIPNSAKGTAISLTRHSVEKDFRSLPKSVIIRVLARINKLKEDQLPRQALKLSGTEELFRIRVGDYRIIYAIHREAKRITIHYVRHRREIYDKL